MLTSLTSLDGRVRVWCEQHKCMDPILRASLVHGGMGGFHRCYVADKSGSTVRWYHVNMDQSL